MFRYGQIENQEQKLKEQLICGWLRRLDKYTRPNVHYLCILYVYRCTLRQKDLAVLWNSFYNNDVAQASHHRRTIETQTVQPRVDPGIFLGGNPISFLFNSYFSN